jgi:dCTP deaminase
MALIALTTDPRHGAPSVVTSRQEFKPAGTAVLIQEGDNGQLRADAVGCNSGYDLRVGAIYRDHRNSYGRELGREGKIILVPGNAVIIQTEEWIEFPERYFGEIFPKVTMLQQGIANIPSKVDPGFRGKLLITVFNYGRRKVRLARGDPFCSLHVFNVDGIVRPYDKRPPEIGARKSAKWPRQLGDFLDRNLARIAVIASIATVGAILWRG